MGKTTAFQTNDTCWPRSTAPVQARRGSFIQITGNKLSLDSAVHCKACKSHENVKSSFPFYAGLAKSLPHSLRIPNKTREGVKARTLNLAT